MAMMNIEQIADLAEVSRSTVSRVLNNHPSVRPEVRDRVQRVITEYGYAPHAAARSLASQRTKVLGLLIPRSAAFIFSDPFFPQVIQGITEACAKRSYFLMLSMLTSDMEQSFYYSILRGRHLDGVIMVSSDIDDPILPLVTKDQTPLVLIGRHPYFQNISWVDVKSREGAREAVNHLINLGHRRIGTITGPLQMAAAIDRRDGYKQALLEAGLPINPELIVEGDYTQQSGYEQMNRLLALPQPPAAVFIANDTMALGALRAIDEAKLRVPEDVAIVSFDDLPLASFANPPLSTVHQPIYDLGAAAVDLLINLIETPSTKPVQIGFTPKLIVRQSCGAALKTSLPEKGA